VAGAASAAGVWPDTIHVHLFDEASDQEIALERGDIDAAVFWPAELSTRMRGDARWSADVEPDPDNGGRPRTLLFHASSKRLLAALGAPALFRLFDCAREEEP